MLTQSSLSCHHGNRDGQEQVGWYLVLWPQVPGRSPQGEGGLGLGLAPRWASPSLPLGRLRVAGVAREGLGASPPDGPSPSPGEGLPQPRLEDEIDFLAQELARQEAGHSRLTAPPQPEGRLRLLEAGETSPPSPVQLPTALDPGLVLPFNLLSLCSIHPGALRAWPGPQPGPPLHAGSAHAPHHLPALHCVIWACAHVPAGAAGRAR